MTSLSISSPRQYTDRGWPAVSAVIEADGRRREIYYRVSQGPLWGGPEPFLLAALLPAMRLGVPIQAAGMVSDHLLRHLAQIQEVICAWWDGYQPVTIETATRTTTAINPNRRTACFFSGGVDSSYSILTHASTIDDLIFVHGLDIRLDDTPLRVKVARTLHRAAAELGKPLIEVETNVRDLLDPYADWAGESDGAAMASIAHVLSQQIQLVYLSSGGKLSKRMITGGNNPYILHLFGTSEIEIAKLGGNVDRCEKVTYLAQSEAAMHWLRVCWESKDGDYNCCQCPKCLHTMINLHVAGALERCRTFNRPIDIELVRTIALGRSDRRAFALTLAHAEKMGADPALIQAMRDNVQRLEDSEVEDPRFRNEIMKAQRRSYHLQVKLERMRASRSWRITAPLRKMGRGLRTLRERAPWKS